MDFYINFKPPFPSTLIEEGDAIFSLGSCFAENWGRYLEKHAWPSLCNPLGIVYNPASLLRQVEYIFRQREVKDEDWFEHEHLWHHFDLHGSQSYPDRSRAITNVKESLNKAAEFMKKADHCIITLGTSHVFIQKEKGEIVNNCHKLPAGHFDQRMLSVEECVDALGSIRGTLTEHTNAKNIIWTVSPVRHIRRGLIENNRSKARLILAVERITSEFEQDYYFPSYEMLTDVWRDHRFFKEDRVHPTDEILQVIYKAFTNAVFSKEAQKAWTELKAFQKMHAHKVLHPGRPEAKAWEESVGKTKKKLKDQYPWLKGAS